MGSSSPSHSPDLGLQQPELGCLYPHLRTSLPQPLHTLLLSMKGKGWELQVARKENTLAAVPPTLTHPLAAGLSPSLRARSPLLPRLLLLAPPCPTHGLPGAEPGELPPGNHQLLEALSSQNSDRKRGDEG